MQKIVLITLLFLVTAVAKLSAQEVDSVQWSTGQSEPKRYEIGSDKNIEFTGQNVMTIKSIKSKIIGFGTSMKTIKSDLYKGKTVKMSGYVKSEKVKSWAGLWMRVDYYSAAVLAFDNMRRRAIKGTTDWTKYEVVLFVPMEATSISYGVLLDETGQIWFKDIKLEVVEDSVPETGSVKGRENKVVSFEKRAKAIADQIKSIKDNQKNALKAEIEVLDNEVAKGIISKEKAEELKLKKAQERAANIDTKVAIEEAKLSQLIQDKVDGKFEEEVIVRGRTKVILGINNDSIGKYSRELNVTGLKFYNGQEDKQNRQSRRTTTQLVFAAGLNNVVTNGTASKSDFRYWGSHFYEWGLTYNTRILKDNNLLHAKYGFSVMYNNLRPTANRSFVVNDNQTILEVNFIPQEDSRFKNVNLVFPLHLELDFTKPKVKDGKTYFKSHESFRLGLGGFVGTNLKSKQYINYDIDGYKSKEITKGNFNVDNFIYGLSGYLGYGATSLYLKYDLNPLFKNNTMKQNNVSLGLRFDFN